MTTEGGKGNDVSELQLSPRDYLAHLHTHPSLARRDRNDLTPPPVPPSMSGYHVCESILVDGLGSIRDVMLKHLGYARGAPSQPTAIACVYCRRRKVRCSGFDQNPEGRCSSCQRFQQECIFVPEQPRSHIPEGVTALTPDLPHSANSRRCKASFDVQWNVKTFMKEQFEDGRKIPIGSVITLTGSALHTQAETVADYLQRHWGSIVLLDALQQSLDFGSSNVSTDYMNEKLDISFQKSPNPAIQEVLVSGSEYGIVSIAQQLAWLGCALRTSTSGQISQSRCLMTWCVYGATGRTSMEYLDEPLDTGEESCWHALFSNPVIACGFPISDRYHDEKGLEIPVRMMAALGGASRAVEFDGGILIKGFSSIFVPLHRTNASIQWHYIRNEDDIRLPYWEVDDRCLGRALLDTVDYEAVNTKRAFLGWWGKTTSHLGTADADYRILDWSDTKEPVRAHRTGDEYFVSQDNLGSKIINFSLGQKDGKLHISRSGPYQRIIKHASRTPVVLYDTRDKRAWLVPSSAVIAHIAQARHHRDPFSINKMTAELTPTDPALTVQEGAERMLLHSSSVLLYNDELTPGVGEYRFRDMVLSIWSLLENLTDRNVIKGTMKEDSVHETLEPTLRGWEFMDLVQERSPIRLKETALRDGHGEWIKLVQDLNATVFFASGFEDLITPDLEAASGLCQKWQHVPKDKDYLTASISILNILYEEAGSRVTKEHLTSTHLRWSRGKNLFEPCSTISKEYTCNRIQQILQESQVVPEAFRSPELLEEAGAVIFGHTDYPTRPTICYRNRSRNDFRYSEANTYTLHDEDLLPTSPWSPDDMNHEGPCVYDMHTWPSKQKSQRPAKSNSSFDEEPLASIERNPKKRSREQGSIYEEPRQLQRQFRYEPMLKDPGCYAHSTPEISGFEEPPKADLPIRVQSNIEQSSAVQSAT
ncbi:hypothetical protein BDZ45DRAFT_476525 [Acephala macrosclerotiorum]|nr:hypothetical protein BDZ45DRAFT_476525 [Acephala macrosclerotiorum]